MWVMTTEGFYSIVSHRKNRRWVLVRARAKEDLERLIYRIDQLPAGFCDGRPLRGQIREVSPSDYEFRMWVEREVMATIMAEHTAEIPYENFKSAVAKVDLDREHIYHRVWAVLAEIGGRWGYSYRPQYFGEQRTPTQPTIFGRETHAAFADRDDPYPAVGLEDELAREDEILKDFEARHGVTEIGEVAEFKRRQAEKETKRKRRKDKKRRFKRG